MTLLPTLSGDVEKSIDALGTPMPVADENGRVFMLVEPVFTDDPLGGYLARIPGIEAFGGGETKEEAALALREALRALNDETTDS